VVGDRAWSDQRIDTRDTSLRATWHTPEGGGIACQSQSGNGGGEGLHSEDVVKIVRLRVIAAFPARKCLEQKANSKVKVDLCVAMMLGGCARLVL